MSLASPLVGFEAGVHGVGALAADLRAPVSADVFAAEAEQRQAAYAAHRARYRAEVQLWLERGRP